MAAEPGVTSVHGGEVIQREGQGPSAGHSPNLLYSSLSQPLLCTAQTFLFPQVYSWRRRTRTLWKVGMGQILLSFWKGQRDTSGFPRSQIGPFSHMPLVGRL